MVLLTVEVSSAVAAQSEEKSWNDSDIHLSAFILWRYVSQSRAGAFGGAAPRSVGHRDRQPFRLPQVEQCGRRVCRFNSNRHTFVTTLERSRVRQKVAQTLARHSDIRLTLGIHTYAALADQTDVITSLPGPPGSAKQASVPEATRDDKSTPAADQPRDFSSTPGPSVVYWCPSIRRGDNTHLPRSAL